jgi:hypothetical protein
MNWIQRNFPQSTKFVSDFFEAMNNKASGHSLRKWLAVGFFWLSAKVTLSYTDKDNLIMVLTILSGMITTLIITYTVGNVHMKKTETKTKTNEITEEPK